MMYRYFLHRQTYRYTNVLQDLVYNYNHRPHGPGFSPAEITKDVESKVWKYMYIDKMKLKKKTKSHYKFQDWSTCTNFTFEVCLSTRLSYKMETRSVSDYTSLQKARNTLVSSKGYFG